MLEYPHGDLFQRGLFQSLNVIEQAVIQWSNDILDDLLDLPEITNPSLVSLGFAAQRYPPLEAMTVNLFEQVIRVRMTEIMGGFELEILFNLERHGRVT